SLTLLQMHRCLRIPEILNLVCECILADRLRSKPTLISLAECCKTFYGPAVSALWRELDSLLPLLRSLPCDLWSTTGDVHKYVITRPIKSTDLERFNHYASLVHSIDVDWLPDATCLAAIQLSCPRPLLRNLRRLKWSPATSPATFSHILLFLGSTITHLHIHLPGKAPYTLSLMPRLPIMCPHVEDIHISGISRSGAGDQLAIVSEVVCRWDSLRVINIPHASIVDLPRLAALPRLSDLTLWSPHLEAIGISPLGPSAFSSLRSLCVRPMYMEYGIQLLRALPRLRLHSFNITCWDTRTNRDWPSLVAAIETAFEHTALRSLYIDENAEYEVERLVAAGDTSKWPRALDFALIRRFTVFNNLTDLTIGCWGGYLLDDDELCRLAEAWPQLEVLTLQTKRVMRPITCTMRALVAFARYCSRLRYLGLDFDAQSLMYDPTETRGVRQGALRSLEVYRSPIKSARVVAAFISSLFPGIDTVWTVNSIRDPEVDDLEVRFLDEEEEKARVKKWEQVERLLPLLKIVRAEGRIEGAGAEPTADAEATTGMAFTDVDYDTDYSEA
ncbi:hypothetical protein EV121DRAFT_200613, partial [Schizophyllum commune]